MCLKTISIFLNSCTAGFPKRSFSFFQGIICFPRNRIRKNLWIFPHKSQSSLTEQSQGGLTGLTTCFSPHPCLTWPSALRTAREQPPVVPRYYCRNDSHQPGGSLCKHHFSPYQQEKQELPPRPTSLPHEPALARPLAPQQWGGKGPPRRQRPRRGEQRRSAAVLGDLGGRTPALSPGGDGGRSGATPTSTAANRP